MRSFLKKCALFICPVICLVAVSEWLLRSIPNDYASKVEYYRKSGQKIQTLILGNSHAFYDLDPAGFTTPTFNGAHVAQTLDIDAKIFEKFSPLLPNLKRVIISISDMSLFFKLSHSNETWRLKNYTIYYNLPTRTSLTDQLEVLDLPFSINRNRLADWYLLKRSPLTISELGFGTNYNSKFAQDLDETAIGAAKVHTITDRSDYPEELAALDRILKLCTERGIRVTMVLPPAYKSYRDRIDPDQLRITLHVCDSLQSTYNNVRFYNLLGDSSYKAADYYDADHLNEKGAAKLSRTIDRF